MSLLIVLLQAPHVPWRCQAKSAASQSWSEPHVAWAGSEVLGTDWLSPLPAFLSGTGLGSVAACMLSSGSQQLSTAPGPQGESQLLAEAPGPPLGPVAMGSFLLPQAAGCSLAHCHPGSGFPQRTSRCTCVIGLSGDRNLTL